MNEPLWQLARVYVRSFDGKELLLDGVKTIRPGDDLTFVRHSIAIEQNVKPDQIRLEIIE